MMKLKEKKSKPMVEEIPVAKEQLELEAYYHWLDRGCPENDALADWVEVEKKWVGKSEIAGEGDD